MSGLLAGKVWHSALPAHLKPTAAALADEARDDGSNCRPGVDLVTWKLGHTRRATQQHISALRELGVLKPVCHEGCTGTNHGAGQPIAYYFDAEALPSRPTWAEERERLKAARARQRAEKGATVTPFEGGGEGEKGETDDVGSAHPEAKRAQSGAERAHLASPDPLIDPYQIDPSDQIDPSTHTAREHLTLLPQVEPGPKPPVKISKARPHPVYAALCELRSEYQASRPSIAEETSLRDWSNVLTLEHVSRIREKTERVPDPSWPFARSEIGRVVAALERGRDPWREPTPRERGGTRRDPGDRRDEGWNAAAGAGVVVGMLEDGTPVRRGDVERGSLADGRPVPERFLEAASP